MLPVITGQLQRLLKILTQEAFSVRFWFSIESAQCYKRNLPWQTRTPIYPALLSQMILTEGNLAIALYKATQSYIIVILESLFREITLNWWKWRQRKRQAIVNTLHGLLPLVLLYRTATSTTLTQWYLNNADTKRHIGKTVINRAESKLSVILIGLLNRVKVSDFVWNIC